MSPRVSPESLQSAWRWCSGLQCSGSTNTLDALKFGLSLTDVHGLYLLTDGSPDLVCTLEHFVVSLKLLFLDTVRFRVVCSFFCQSDGLKLHFEIFLETVFTITTFLTVEI